MVVVIIKSMIYKGPKAKTYPGPISLTSASNQLIPVIATVFKSLIVWDRLKKHNAMSICFFIFVINSRGGKNIELFYDCANNLRFYLFVQTIKIIISYFISS